MKRIISIMLSVLIVFSFADCAFAEKEVTFRGIPWGSSVQETINMLKADFGDNIEWKLEETNEYTTSMPYYWFGLTLTVSVPNLKVAGFEVTSDSGGYTSLQDKPGRPSRWSWVPTYDDSENIIMYFIPMLNEDKTDYSLEEGRLWAAKYASIKPGDGMSLDDTAGELREKLTELYESEPSKPKKPSKRFDEIDIVREWKIGKSIIWLYFRNEKYSYNPEKPPLYTEGEDWVLTSLIYVDNSLQDEYDQICTIRKAKEEGEKEEKQRQKDSESDSRGTDGL